MIFRARHRQFEFPRPAVIMGILNVTPDSFSDGGKYFEPARAIERGLEMVEEGAEIIDVGGESTRPGADPVGAQEELRRVLPVIEGLSAHAGFALSIDTQKAAVAREALAAGAHIVNDIAANREEPELWEAAAAAGAGYVLMHMQGSPATMQQAPVYGDVIAEVSDFFADRLGKCQRAGLHAEQIVLDPGIGFGKTAAHNLRLLAGLDRFRVHNRPLLLGVSRKSFMGRLIEAGVTDRLPASLACTVWGVERGAQFIRTHDVAETRQAVRMFECLLSDAGRLGVD